MQDVQNIPPPDTSPNHEEDDFGSHSDLNPEIREGDIENPGVEGNVGEEISGREKDGFISPDDAENGENESDLM